MATIEALAKHPEATYDPMKQMAEGVREGDPKRAYAELARFVTTLVGGPNLVHDSVVEEANRQLFIRDLEICADAIRRNETREAASIMNAWSYRWKTEDAKALLPEHLMPVAMLTEGIVKSVDDSVTFVSPIFDRQRVSSVKKYLKWVHSAMLANEVNPREFFSAQHVHKVLPFRTVTAESQATH